MHIAAYSRCEWVAARSCLEPLIRTVICVKTSEAGPLIVVTHHDTLCVEARGGADVIVRYVERDCRQIPETHLVSMFGWSRVAIDIVNLVYYPPLFKIRLAIGFNLQLYCDQPAELNWHCVIEPKGWAFRNTKGMEGK